MRNQKPYVLRRLRENLTRGAHSWDLRIEGIGNPSQRMRDLRKLGHDVEALDEPRDGCPGVRYFLRREAEISSGDTTASAPTTAASIIAADLGAPHAAAADGSPLLPAVGGHPSFGGSPGHVQAGQSLPLPPSGLGGSPESSLGVKADVSAGDGLPPVAGSLFSAEEFARRDHWREVAA